MLDFGSTSSIYKVPFGVQKQTRKRDSGKKSFLSIEEEKQIHSRVFDLLKDPFYTILLTPRLNPDSNNYEMEYIDTSVPLWLSLAPSIERLTLEVACLWKTLYREGWALYDFELYRQPDGRVMILDFNHTKPASHVHEDRLFFLHPSFPRGAASHWASLSGDLLVHSPMLSPNVE